MNMNFRTRLRGTIIDLIWAVCRSNIFPAEECLWARSSSMNKHWFTYKCNKGSLSIQVALLPPPSLLHVGWVTVSKSLQAISQVMASTEPWITSRESLREQSGEGLKKRMLHWRSESTYKRIRGMPCHPTRTHTHLQHKACQHTPQCGGGSYVTFLCIPSGLFVSSACSIVLLGLESVYMQYVHLKWARAGAVNHFMNLCGLLSQIKKEKGEKNYKK